MNEIFMNSNACRAQLVWPALDDLQDAECHGLAQCQDYVYFTLYMSKPLQKAWQTRQLFSRETRAKTAARLEKPRHVHEICLPQA
jgi:hypothetical protein